MSAENTKEVLPQNPKLDPRKFGARVTCATCSREKRPLGRSASIYLYSSLCDVTCDGYYQDPKPGSLWPNESEADFGYPVGTDGTEIR